MATPASNEIRFTFENPHLPEDEFVVTDFVGEEVISQPYRFVLNLLSKNTAVPFSDLINQPATLTMRGGDEVVPIHGIVADFEQGSPVGDYVGYRAILVPRLWRLSLTHRSRVFQHLSVPEIVRQVLEEAGLGKDDFRFDLSASYAPREYCAQYKETDLAFVSRLLEYEGIQYFFEHGQQDEILVMIDERSKTPAIPGDEEVIYRPAQGFAPEHEETIREFIFREQIVTGKVILKDYNYRTPDTDLRAESQLTDEMPGTYYDYGIHFKDGDTGTRLARVRNEELESQRRRGTGEGTCIRLRAGHRFELDKHYRLDLNRPYLVTEVSHAGSQRGAASMQAGTDKETTYSNAFTCIPADVQYRPPRVTPEPKLPGIMTAKVESGGGEYAYLDDEGRYRIKMPFDLADTEQASASKPIRLAQPYAGADYGMHFPVHADAEMVFACVDGNVDRPLGLSTVPNPRQGSPVTGENHTKNVIKTASDNRIEMEDEKGNERIKLYSPHENSILQLGSPNQPVSGSVLTTKGSSVLHGEKGLLLSTYPGQEIFGIEDMKSVTSKLATAASLAISYAKFKGVGGFSFDWKSVSGFKLMKTALGLGVGAPGVMINAIGSIKLVTPDSIYAMSILGIKMIAADSIEAVSGKSFNVGVNDGVAFFARQKDFRVLAGQNVELTAEKGSASVEADQEIKLRSMNSNIRLLTLKDNKILLQSRNLIRQEAKKDVEIESQEGQVSVSAKNDVLVESKDGNVGVVGKEEVIIGSESDCVTISGGGGGSGVLKDNVSVAVKGNGFRVDAEKGIYIGVNKGTVPPRIQFTSTSMVVGIGNAQISMNSAGVMKLQATSIELNSKALLQLKAALSKVG